MEDNKIVRAEESTIKGLLVGFQKCFVIPPFQRNYSWDAKQCKELYEDMVSSAISGTPHYLGNIVAYSGKNSRSSFNERVLVDGQQRITTILLLICAIKDVIDDEKKKDELLKHYLINDSSEDRRVRLKQASGDIVVFESILNNKIDNLTEKQLSSQLMLSYNFFVSNLKKEDRVDIKDKLLEAIVNTEIVEISLINNDNLKAVQTIFEKINSTGKPLTSGDLIRNYLLFADSTEEQEKLYEEYWIPIEEKISDITKFSKVYYILDSLEYFDEDDIYVTFKEYYSSKKISHKSILEGMKITSEFYNMIENNTINNDQIKRNIKYLKKLQYDDLLPFLTYSYKATFQNNKSVSELSKIIDLLVDFMFRYRIVKPYTGGGPAKKLVLNILTKLKNNEIELTYDDILYELSNSSELNQRFPLDDEFCNSLISGDKEKYKRELLLRLEDKESKSLKIDVDDKDLTLEHLMPQTKSKWWEKNMGGSDKYQLTVEKYLNSIGNLAILSRALNSVNSNDPWKEKLPQLKTAQFKVTQEVAKNEKWTEKEIISRNKKLSKRLCKYIAGPLPRERAIDSIKSNDSLDDDFEPGVYDLFDSSFPDSHIAVSGIQIEDDIIKVSSWRELFNKLCYLMIKEDNDKFDTIVKENLIHKSTSSSAKGMKDPIISKDFNLLQKAMPIENSKYFTEAVLSQSRALVYARQLVQNINCNKSIKLVLR